MKLPITPFGDSFRVGDHSGVDNCRSVNNTALLMGNRGGDVFVLRYCAIRGHFPVSLRHGAATRPSVIQMAQFRVMAAGGESSDTAAVWKHGATDPLPDG